MTYYTALNILQDIGELQNIVMYVRGPSGYHNSSDALGWFQNTCQLSISEWETHNTCSVHDYAYNVMIHSYVGIVSSKIPVDIISDGN